MDGARTITDVLWLGDEACGDRRRTGGKAAELSRLAARFSVPPGFCLAVDGEPDAAAVAAAYEEAGRRAQQPGPVVAVRSSALDEDGENASFAGQHESYLGISGADDVRGAIALCAASARSERAQAYRRSRHLPESAGAVPVLVQVLVPADIAVVAFSVDPVSRDRDQILINASWGLGDSVVGGTVSPDAFAVRRADLSIAERRIADKRRMTITAAGGTREVAVPGPLRREPSLDDEQVQTVARLALDVEAALGTPVDVEGAWAGGRLHLLQARPITTLE